MYGVSSDQLDKQDSEEISAMDQQADETTPMVPVGDPGKLFSFRLF